jgi:hypothetical protein
VAVCRLSGELTLDAGRVAAFIAEYRSAGGEFDETERRASVELIRITRLGEALYSLGQGHRGLDMEWDNLVSNVEAIEYLDWVPALQRPIRRYATRSRCASSATISSC